MTSISTMQAKDISQDMLANLMELIEEGDEAKRRYEEIRQSIVDLVDRGAEVEPGPLSCRVDDYERRQFSAPRLGEILGADEVEKLKELMPAIAVRTLRVFKAGGSEEGVWEVDD